MTTVRTRVRTILCEKKVERIVGRKGVGEVEDAFLDSDHLESVRTDHSLGNYTIQFPTVQPK